MTDVGRGWDREQLQAGGKHAARMQAGETSTSGAREPKDYDKAAMCRLCRWRVVVGLAKRTRLACACTHAGMRTFVIQAVREYAVR